MHKASDIDTSDHVLTLFQNKFISGDAEGTGETVSAYDFLTRIGTDDMHAASYVVTSGPWSCRRLRKRDYHTMLEDGVDTRIMRSVMVDVDTPDHSAVTQRWLDTQAPALQCACEELGDGLWYMTKHGYRVLWELPQPITPPEYEHLVSQLIDKLREEYGIMADKLCDWTRLFRAPHAKRDGVVQMMPVERGVPGKLRFTPSGDPSDIGASGHEAIPDTLKVEPDHESITSPKQNARIWSKLKPLEELPLLMSSSPIAESGSRHATTLSVAAKICRLADTIDPMVPYEALIGSWSAMQGSSRRALTGKELHKLCVYACESYNSYRNDTARSAVEARCKLESTGLDLSSLVYYGMRPFEAWIYDEKLGTHCRKCYDKTSISMELHRWCPEITSGACLTDKGGFVNSNDTLYTFGTQYERVIYSYLADEVEFSGGDLTVPALDRPSIKAVRHDEVDQWLRAMGGSEADYLLDWIATIDELSRPSCALYIEGPPSIGKGMLSLGLSKLWGSQSHCIYSETILGSFDEDLISMPLVVADESISDSHKSNPSADLRRAIGDTQKVISRKHRTSVTLVGARRFLITANNSNAIDVDDLKSLSDVSAVQLRIGHIYVPGTMESNEPRRVLDNLAARAGEPPAKYTERFVDGLWIAEHAKWLAETRQVRSYDNRLAVQGWASKLVRNLPLSGEVTEKVLTTLIHHFIDGHVTNGIEVDPNGILVNISCLQGIWKKINRENFVPDARAIREALRPISAEESERLRVLGKRVRVWRITRETVLDACEYYEICDESEMEKIMDHSVKASEDSGAQIEI